jgi:hypothetical protein
LVRQVKRESDYIIPQSDRLRILRELFLFYLYVVYMMTRSGQTSLDPKRLAELATSAGAWFLAFLAMESKEETSDADAEKLANEFADYTMKLTTGYSPMPVKRHSFEGTIWWAVAERVAPIVKRPSIEVLALSLSGILSSHQNKHGLTA